MAFADMGLAPALLQSLANAGFTEPTPVQAAAIPMALEGHDLLVSSQTGSGKTAAFMLPCLHRLLTTQPSSKAPRILVLTPTRELAQQVAKASVDFGGASTGPEREFHKGRGRQRKGESNAEQRPAPAATGPKIAVLVGGTPYAAQLRQLRGPLDIVVATPGRLLDHLENGKLELNRIDTLVLDEADRMLDMGFIDDIEAIAARLPNNRQTLLFSATLDGVVGNLASRLTRDARRIEIAKSPEATPKIEQTLYYADDHGHKLRLLDALLAATGDEGQAVIFTATKLGAEDLADRLREAGHSAQALHGDMHQGARNRTLKSLHDGRTRILVATDVAARGLDVPGISHVVNFDLPMLAEDYVHRIGRTGRAGREGQAYTLAHHRERGKVRGIERYTGGSIPVTTLPGLEPKARPERSFQPGGKKPGGYGGKPGYGGGKPGGYGRPGGNERGSMERGTHERGGYDRAAQDRYGNSERPRHPGEGWASGAKAHGGRNDFHGDFQRHETRHKPAAAKRSRSFGQ